ncbi:hypothetical protein CLOSTHATH_06741 [Hungatella hathewayi DSM 13479]|uniref:Uncharacterized protein n=1 Tax=Hungatella hathewayi DSM 13479 TaxID=566550 RepID=D3ASY2_9FIRM|nr:hypothetical protein CLOSTHATH_06741 [Hungatella hathewayi DSM 13479]
MLYWQTVRSFAISDLKLIRKHNKTQYLVLMFFAKPDIVFSFLFCYNKQCTG